MARFWVGLPNEPVETTTLYVLQNPPSLFQLRLRGMKDLEEEAVVDLGVGHHVIDGIG